MSEEESSEEESKRKFGISMKQWSASLRRVLPEKFNFVPHLTYLKFLRMIWLTVFQGYSINGALDDCDMSSSTFYKEEYKSFRAWLKKQALEIRDKLAKGRELKSALPKSARQKLSDIVWSVVVDKSEEFKRLKEDNKAKDRRIEELKQKMWKERGRKEAKGERTEEEKAIREGLERVKEGGSFVKSAEWDKYLGEESEEE